MKSLFSLGALVLLTSITSCSNPVVTSSSTPGLVTVSLTSSRTAVAQDPTSSITKYRLSGGLHGASQTVLKSASSTAGIVVQLQAGAWDFTLDALEGTNGDVPVLTGTLTNQVLASDPVTLAFTLKTLTSGTGSLDLTVNWPSNKGIALLDALWNGTSLLGGKVSASGTSYHLTQSGIAAGVGILSFQFFNASGVLMATLSDAVRISPNLTSTDSALTLQSSDINTAPVAPGTPVLTNQSSTDPTASVLVQWADNSTNESGFEVWRDGTKLTTTLGGVTSFVDTGASRSSSHTYKVIAVNNWGSNSSATASKTTRSLVTFDYQGATGNNSQAVAETNDSGAVATLPSPTKTNEHFERWNSDAGLTTAFVAGTSTVAAATTLYASWDVQVSFDSGSGTAVATQTIREGASAVKPTDPTRANFTFDKWYTTGTFDTAADFNTTYTADATLFAKWVPNYSISTTLVMPQAGPDQSQDLGDAAVGAVVTANLTVTGTPTISWFVDGVSVTGSSSSYSWDTTGLAAGVHELVASISDGSNLVTGRFRVNLVN